MPRLYLLPGQFDMFPAALAFAFQVTQLKAIPGAMDQLLARASGRVDSHARKRVGAPKTTTVGTAGILAGGTLLPVASTLGFDEDAEQAVIIGSGGTQEIIPVEGIDVTEWANPYPGTIRLARPVAYSHSSGQAVQGCYQEISKVGNPGGRDLEEQAWTDPDQAMHTPMSAGKRTIFLKCYPIIQLYKLEYTLPINAEYTNLGLPGVQIHPSSGYIRLPISSFVVAGGMFRATYTAGFASVPSKIQEATSWYAADDLQSMVSKGAYEIQSGKSRARYSDGKTAKSIYEQRAEEIINRGYRRTA